MALSLVLEGLGPSPLSVMSAAAFIASLQQAEGSVARHLLFTVYLNISTVLDIGSSMFFSVDLLK